MLQDEKVDVSVMVSDNSDEDVAHLRIVRHCR
jgi:hypothetical protein